MKSAVLVAAAAVLLAWRTGILSNPVVWGLTSVCVWAFFVALRGWTALSVWDKRQCAFGIFTALLFLNFLSYDEGFEVRGVGMGGCSTAPPASVLQLQPGFLSQLPDTILQYEGFISADLVLCMPPCCDDT